MLLQAQSLLALSNIAQPFFPTPPTCRGNNLLDLLEHRNETAALVEAIYTAGLADTLEGAHQLRWTVGSPYHPSTVLQQPSHGCCLQAAGIHSRICDACFCPAEIDDDATLFAPIDAAFDALLEKLNVNLTDLAANPKLLTGERAGAGAAGWMQAGRLLAASIADHQLQ